VQLFCKQIRSLDIQDELIVEGIENDESAESENEDSDKMAPDKGKKKAKATDKKDKKKAKAAELAELKKLPLEDIMEMIPDPKEVIFKPFSPGRPREPKVNIPPNVDATDPLALLDLFIPSEMYTTIEENTNLYAITNNAPTSNSRYWRPTNENEIHVFFGILLYMGVHKEPNFLIYWEKGNENAPSHAISSHMSLNRYENLRRYIHVSEPTQFPPEPRTEEEEEKLPTETLEKL